MKNVVVFGAGIAGCTIARLFADKGHKVTIFEKRNHVGGNIFDEYNKHGILIQKYGPHIFHTNDKEVFDFLSRFTEWIPYVHKIKGYIDGKLTDIPFNFSSLEQHFNYKVAEKLELKLAYKFGANSKVPIYKLREDTDEDLVKLADFIYKKVFETYSKKQWGFDPALLGEEVLGRVPIYTGYDNRYFTDKYQCQPLMGFTHMINNMLMHPNIDVILNANQNAFGYTDNGKIVIYCGSIDELFCYVYGDLPYRSLDFKMKTFNRSMFQPLSVINYNTSEKFTRITEFKHLTMQRSDKTTICIEYSRCHKRGKEAYYPIPTKAAKDQYEKYLELSKERSNLYFLGRLGTYKYLNMDAAVKQAMSLFEEVENAECYQKD